MLRISERKTQLLFPFLHNYGPVTGMVIKLEKAPRIGLENKNCKELQK